MIWTPWGPMHFCVDEARMLFWGFIGALPFVGVTWFWVRSKFKKHEKKEQDAHHPCCHPDDKHEG